jgi:hypothetical protein
VARQAPGPGLAAQFAAGVGPESGQAFFDSGFDFAGFGEAVAFVEFAENQLAIKRYIENSTTAGLEFGIDLEFLVQICGQTGRKGQVVSHRAVLDDDFHRLTLARSIRFDYEGTSAVEVVAEYATPYPADRAEHAAQDDVLTALGDFVLDYALQHAGIGIFEGGAAGNQGDWRQQKFAEIAADQGAAGIEFEVEGGGALHRVDHVAVP